MVYTKLYKYDSSKSENEFRGEDFSAHVLIGDTETDNLTEVMGTVELTLSGLTFSQEFSPKTKFIYEKWDGEPYAETSFGRSWHIVVQEDVVSKPVLSDDNYFDHHITFIEASALAQGRLVDNISVTYKLQDVSLEGDVIVGENEFAKMNLVPIRGQGGTFYKREELGIKQYRFGKSFSWEFADWFPTDSEFYGTRREWATLKYYQAIDPDVGNLQISLPIPMLRVSTGSEINGFSFSMGFCDVITTVTEKNLSTGETKITTLYTSPSSSVPTENNWTNDWALDPNFDTSSQNPSYKGLMATYVSYTQTDIGIGLDIEVKKTRIANFVNTPSNRRININAKPNCVYTINTVPRYRVSYYTTGYAKRQPWVFGWEIKSPEVELKMDAITPSATLEFRTYLKGDKTKIVFKSAPPENAYELFQKAQINTQNVIKQIGTPIQNTKQAFYMSSNDEIELRNTTVIENFYNQKNWWELLLEIGKYIHSIPKVRFGDEEDRFLIEWKRLGVTNQQEDDSTKISIFNSKSIENYISSCSSYITNMVQLGGVIDEWIAPKSSSENYLVYNDVAEIQTSKPIIEIVSLEAKCVNSNDYGISVNDIRSLTPESKNGYIFEENIYNVLDIDVNSSINKGLAIYYELGSNIIKGLNYRSPTVNTGDPYNDYSIKKIIGKIFGISNTQWSKIRINDFVFHIVYRTKDTVRSDQTRPDLRKYLLSSKYDRVPQHNQFNNQTDIVIDSVKFGNNIYGKLIKTGNSNYTVTEWVESLSNTKEVGQLYNIRGELYYVATVKNTFYGTHIISEVTYSKDYNQLSEIVGIPSEPRFYEISEQSLIEREVPLNDYVVLGTKIMSQNNLDSFIRDKGWSYINRLLFSNEDNFPKYAVTVFKNDQDRKYGDVINNENFYKDVCHPISTYSIQNTLTMEWDMVDNFSAGDRVNPTPLSLESNNTVNSSYSTLQPIKYTDVFGRSDLVDFIIIEDFDDGLSPEQIRNLPDSPVRTRFPEYSKYVGSLSLSRLPTTQELNDFVQSQLGRGADNGDGIAVAVTVIDEGNVITSYYLYLFNNGSWTSNQVPNDYVEELTRPYLADYEDKYLFGNEKFETLGDNLHGLGLLKDNREKISFNYNLQMITDSDRFVLSSWLWQPNKGTLRLALLNEEINKISNDGIPYENILTTRTLSTIVDEANGVITIDISNALGNIDLTDVKAIAIVSDKYTGSYFSGKYFVAGRNIGGLTENEAKSNWYISNYDKSMFPHQ